MSLRYRYLMPSIHLPHLDKTRPVLVLTRELVRPHLSRITVAPITGTAALHAAFDLEDVAIPR